MLYTRALKIIPTIILSCLLVSNALASQNYAERKDVKAFINKMVKKHKFNKKKLTALFKQVKDRPQVMRNIKAPLEAKPWHTYQMLFVSEWRIKNGVEFWKKYEKALKRAEKKYKVPASVIVATIGIETRYGQRTGQYRVMDSLSNIGFSQSRRAPFFRRELEQLLLLAREQKINPLKIRGSYAGAIGQPQFMPSSYRHYAVDFSKTGTIDLMNDEVDVIGSIANYYSRHGWKMKQPVAVKIESLGKRTQKLLAKKKLKQPLLLKDLKKYSIKPEKKLGKKTDKVRILTLDSRYKKEYWLSYHNFNVIKRYNTSNLYAMAVYQLSGYIEDLRKRLHNA